MNKLSVGVTAWERLKKRVSVADYPLSTKTGLSLVFAKTHE